VSSVMALFFEALSNDMAELVETGVQRRFCGDRSRFESELQQLMGTAEQKTAGEDKRLILNICINYGGRWDIVQAIRAIAAKIEANELTCSQIDMDIMAEHLATYPLPSPDLLIRTSGEYRLSNFFLWQAAYTELYFTETLWPDFNEGAFERALQDYEKRERRFGLVESRKSC